MGWTRLYSCVPLKPTLTIFYWRRKVKKLRKQQDGCQSIKYVIFRIKNMSNKSYLLFLFAYRYPQLAHIRHMVLLKLMKLTITWRKESRDDVSHFITKIIEIRRITELQVIWCNSIFTINFVNPKGNTSPLNNTLVLEWNTHIVAYWTLLF